MSTFTVKARCASSGSESSPTYSPTEPSSTTLLSGKVSDAPILETPAHPLERHILPISDPEDRVSDPVPVDPVFGDEAEAAIHYKTMSWWYVPSVLPPYIPVIQAAKRLFMNSIQALIKSYEPCRVPLLLLSFLLLLFGASTT
jgi:hypothetical protein